MNQALKRFVLPFTVFITGACVLIIEVVAIRILSPYYGNTIFAVSSVLSIILAALSLGYAIGGRLADRHPDLKWFYGIILLSGFFLLILYSLGRILLDRYSTSLSLTTGPLLFSAALFFSPALLLGMLSPFAIRLQMLFLRAGEEKAGSISGLIFFWSTLGSITGSLLSGFVLIPWMGIHEIMMGVGILLFLMALIPLLKFGIQGKYRAGILVLIGLIWGESLWVEQNLSRNFLFERDGIYERITVVDGNENGRPARFFRQDRGDSAAMYLDTRNPTDVVYGYTQYYKLYKLFKPDLRRVLVIGGAGFTIPKALLHELPHVEIDVAEIEPLTVEVAKKYFSLQENPRLHIHIEDGRRFLRDSKVKYDLIFSDVYYSLFSIPSHFVTREFFETVKRRLAPGGILAINLIGDLSRQTPSLALSEIKTVKAVFPNSYFFAVDSPGIMDSQNIIMVGMNSDRVVDIFDSKLENHPEPLIRSLSVQSIDLNRFDWSRYFLLTDNYSPVEYLTFRVLQRYSDLLGSVDGNEIVAFSEQLLQRKSEDSETIRRQKVQNVIHLELEEMAHEMHLQNWADQRLGEKGHYTNIQVRFFPWKPRRVLLAAYYPFAKSISTRQGLEDEKKQEALNSATSVALLIEMSRAILELNDQPDVGFDLVFLDGDGSGKKSGTETNESGISYLADHFHDFYPEGKVPFQAILLKVAGCGEVQWVDSNRLHPSSATIRMRQYFEKNKSEAFHVVDGKEEDQDPIILNQMGIPTVLLKDSKNSSGKESLVKLDSCHAQGLQELAHCLITYLYNVE